MVEFSLLAPVFFLLLVGVLDLGRAGFYFVVGSDLARQGARYASAWGNNGSGYTDPTVAGMIQQQALHPGRAAARRSDHQNWLVENLFRRHQRAPSSGGER